MNRTIAQSFWQRPLIAVALCILVLSGLGFLYSALSGDSAGLKAWLRPLGPWFCALVAFRLLRQWRG